MAKLRPEDSGEIIFDADDSPIGLTQAFAPIGDDDDFDQFGYDDADKLDDPFADDFAEDSWDYSDKWAGFDWNASFDDESDEVADEAADEMSDDVLDEDSDEELDEPEDVEEVEEPEEAGEPEDAAAEDIAEDIEEVPEESEEAIDEAEEAADEIIGAVEEAEEAVEEAVDETAETAEEAAEEIEEAAEETVEAVDGAVEEAAEEAAEAIDDTADTIAEVAEEADIAEEIEAVKGDEAAETIEEAEAAVEKKARHGRHAAVPVEDSDGKASTTGKTGVVPVGTNKPEMTERQIKQRQTRHRLLALLVVLALVIVGVGYYAYQLFTESAIRAEQQTHEQASEAAAGTNIANNTGNDAVQTTSHRAEVPNLAQLIGKSQDEAVTLLEHGAMVSNTRAVDEEGSAIKTSVTVTLTSEPVDSRTGSPTVYLGLTEDGRIVQAGYSASAGALGFGTLSFRDAVNTEHVVEKTLQDAGIKIPEGSAVLPEDSASYSTYASDGKTLVRERCSFEGTAQVGDIPCTWSAVLSYDYTTMNLTGNMNDTVRVIYAYVTSPDATAPEKDKD